MHYIVRLDTFHDVFSLLPLQVPVQNLLPFKNIDDSFKSTFQLMCVWTDLDGEMYSNLSGTNWNQTNVFYSNNPENAPHAVKLYSNKQNM